MAQYKQPSRINIVSILLLGVVLGAVYTGVKFVPHYWRDRKVEEVLGVAVNRFFRERTTSGVEESVRAEVEAHVRALGVDDPELRVFVERRPDVLRVSVQYTVVVSHPGRKITTLRFAPSAETDSKTPFD